MFGGFAALLWAAAILCFVATAIQAAEDGDEMVSEPLLGVFNKLVNLQALDNLYIGIALVVVVVVTGLFTYYQENKSSNIMESFAKMTPPKAQVKISLSSWLTWLKVLRDGAQKEIEAAELVVGDIVYIKGGDKTPADIRMIVCHSIKVAGMSTELLWSLKCL